MTARAAWVRSLPFAPATEGQPHCVPASAIMCPSLSQSSHLCPLWWSLSLPSPGPTHIHSMVREGLKHSILGRKLWGLTDEAQLEDVGKHSLLLKERVWAQEAELWARAGDAKLLCLKYTRPSRKPWVYHMLMLLPKGTIQFNFDI